MDVFRPSNHRPPVITFLLSLGLAASASAQSSFATPSPSRNVPVAWRPMAPLQPVRAPRNDTDLGTLNRYMSYGSVIGIAGGLVWGAATSHRQTRTLDIAGDAAIGWVIGMAGGAVVYLVHEVKH